MKELIFTINGPGELAGLAIPLVKAFRRTFKNVRYTLCTVPCQFASGLESDTAKKTGLFDEIISVQEYKKYWITKTLPQRYTPLPEGIVFYLGGDAFHALLIAKRLGYQPYGYDEGNVGQKNKFKKLFTRGLDGDLMVDAARERDLRYQAEPIGSSKVTIGLYPGSRPTHIPTMVSILSGAATALHAKYPNIQFRWGVPDQVRTIFEAQHRYPAAYETPGTTYDLIVSLTGTNTAISATLGIPLLVLLPFNEPKLIPMMGLFGLITMIPGFGALLKRLVIPSIVKKMKLISIPNIKAGRKIVPELIGIITEAQIVEAVEKLLMDVAAREQMHEELPIFMGTGVAGKIVDYYKGFFS
jgi:lipid-A-disaccharide synthase